MDRLDIVKCIVKSLSEKKAYDINTMNIKDISVICDFFIIASGNSNVQVKALVDEVEFKLSNEFNIHPKNVERYQSANWVILDYNDIVIHIFDRNTREFYDLDKMWSDGEKIKFDDIID